MVFPVPAVLDLKCFLNMWLVLPIPDVMDLLRIIRMLCLEFAGILLAIAQRNRMLPVVPQLLHA